MNKAIRLTRAGQIADATAFVQRVLRGAGTDAFDAGNAPAAAPSPIIGIIPDKVELFDRQKSPADGQASQPGTGHPEARVLAAARVPEGLRGFLKRFDPRVASPRSGGAAAPSPAANDLADQGRFLTKSFGNQAGTRTYKLFIPSGYVGQPLPLIVMLHGCKQSPDDFAAGTRMNVLAEAHTCFVAYPAQAASANVSKCWNWFNPGDQRRDQGEPSLIAGITRQVMRDHVVDPRRVYVAGLSAGAAAAVILGATHPDLYAAIGVHSGLPWGAASNLPSALAAMRQGSALPPGMPSGRMIPTIVFHGDRDATVHPRNGDHVIAQAGTANLQTTVQRGHAPGGLAFTRTLHTDARGLPMLEQWVVHGGGHAWFGGSSAGSYADPRGPDAASEMLRFFLGHRHPSAA